MIKILSGNVITLSPDNTPITGSNSYKVASSEIMPAIVEYEKLTLIFHLETNHSIPQHHQYILLNMNLV